MTQLPDARTTVQTLTYVRRGEQELQGDLYVPGNPQSVPVVVAVHGGGWKRGDRRSYQHIGPYLAARGIAVFAISYRLVHHATGANRYPAAVHDVRAAVQFLRLQAPNLNLDPVRIGLIGDSAGAHLGALVALAGDRAPFAGAAEDAFPGVSCAVSALVGFYGVYDLIRQSRNDLLSRPLDRNAERFLGVSPIDDRHPFHEASPLTYATTAANSTAVLLSWGESDEVVDPEIQSKMLLEALMQAQYFTRTVVLHDAGHFWATDPIEEPGSFSGLAMPRIARFLQQRL